MKKLALLVLLAIVGAAGSFPAEARDSHSYKQQTRAAEKAAKKQQKQQKYYSKHQQKAMKKAAKAQRKALKKTQQRGSYRY
jgi:hypothetical protein